MDEILVKYKVDASEFGKVGVAVNTVTAETKELQTQIKATFADKSIETATKHLYEQGDVMGALVNKYGSATSALKAMEKELATMAALGQRGTASFTELANATAELKDTIGDTRGEIKKMASDTKVFDTMVQGARGVAAAFSVATGLAATFGDENKDLQKTLLKVQGAMAALQGVQELANIATEKGGIATKAYGVALQVVDKISKVTGLSMAASWAMATAGITIVIAGVVALISYLNKGDDKSEEFKENEIKRQKELQKQREESESRFNAIIQRVWGEYDRAQDIRRKNAILKNENMNQVELDLLKDKILQSEIALAAFDSVKKNLNEKDAIEYKKYLEDRLLDTKVAYKKIFDATQTPQVTATDNVPKMLTADPLVSQETVDMNKINIDKMMVDFRKYALDAADKAEADALAKRRKRNDEYFAAMGKAISAISNLTNAIFAGELKKNEEKYSADLATLNERRDAELAAVGDNAAKKAAIEERYAKRKIDLEKRQAIEKAKIERQQAIANKAFAIFNIILSTSQAIMKAIESNNYAMAAIAGAMGAVEIAAVSAQPLPAIPKFEKGGLVLAGGRNEDGHLIGRSHRDGGILIEAQGGEYIWDKEATAKHGDIIKAAHENRIEDLVMHKYVIPLIKAREKQSSSSESYDDIYLRRTIQQTSAKSAKYIVEGISTNMKDALYFQNRYK